MVTVQFVQYAEIAPLSSDERIEKLLSYVKDNKILIMEGRLRKDEEASLIAKTMESISKKFTGIELAVVNPNTDEEARMFRKVKGHLITMLLGDRQGMTIIGPASLVKEIKQDPNKIELFLTEGTVDSRRKKRK